MERRKFDPGGVWTHNLQIRSTSQWNTDFFLAWPIRGKLAVFNNWLKHTQRKLHVQELLVWVIGRIGNQGLKKSTFHSIKNYIVKAGSYSESLLSSDADPRILALENEE